MRNAVVANARNMHLFRVLWGCGKDYCKLWMDGLRWSAGFGNGVGGGGNGYDS